MSRRTEEQKSWKWRKFNSAIRPGKIAPTMQVIANHMGVQRSYICLIVNGHRALTPGLAKAFGAVFGVPPAKIRAAIEALGVSRVKRRSIDA